MRASTLICILLSGCDLVSGVSAFTIGPGGGAGFDGSGGAGGSGGASTTGGGGGGCPRPCVWARAIEGEAAVDVVTVKARAQGEMVASILSAGPIPLDPPGFQAVGVDSRIAVFEHDGDLLWLQTFGGEGDQRALALALGEDGDVYVAGSFTEDLALGATGQHLETSVGAEDIFVARLDGSDGSLLWHRHFGTLRRQEALALTIGLGGKVIVGGTFAHSISFTANLTVAATASSNELDGFVAILSPEGEPLAAQDLGNANGNSLVTHLGVAPNRIWAGGRYRG